MISQCVQSVRTTVGTQPNRNKRKREEKKWCQMQDWNGKREDAANYKINTILIFSNETRLYVFKHFDPKTESTRRMNAPFLCFHPHTRPDIRARERKGEIWQNNNQLHPYRLRTMYIQPATRRLFAKPLKMRKQQNNLFGPSRKHTHTHPCCMGHERKHNQRQDEQRGKSNRCVCMSTLGADGSEAPDIKHFSLMNIFGEANKKWEEKNKDSEPFDSAIFGARDSAAHQMTGNTPNSLCVGYRLRGMRILLVPTCTPQPVSHAHNILSADCFLCSFSHLTLPDNGCF